MSETTVHRPAMRDIPAVGELLGCTPLRRLVEEVGHDRVVASARAVVAELRDRIASRGTDGNVPSMTALAEQIAARVHQSQAPKLRAVINATGIVLHTGLGRAPLADEAVRAIVEVANQYASVELDLESGRRSQRIVAVEGLLTELTGAEAAAVVNNNAGATLLTLAALAAGREVIVSRGQLIEIGGSFRLPDVMSGSGCVLREVGTTNKTRLEDYRGAIGDQTAALMLVHTSNFAVVGFTATVTLAELVRLGQEHRLPVIHDIGSGALFDFAEFGCLGEPVAGESIRGGADVVLFSGDKLLGGPQCGIILGKRTYVEQISRHPLMRALRVDKLTLAALAATLRLYCRPDVARREIPVLQLTAAPVESLRERAGRIASRLATGGILAAVETVADTSYIGGGSVPTQEIPTWCVALSASGANVDALARRLRQGEPSIVGRIREGRLLLDLRSVMPRQDDQIIAAIQRLDGASAN